MTTMPAAEFKAKCLKVMERVRKRREEIVITKRGVPVAKLVPVPPPKRKSSIFGFLQDRFEIVGDVSSPIVREEGWETLEEWDQLNK
jgi:prevent-host-death family protein